MISNHIKYLHSGYISGILWPINPLSSKEWVQFINTKIPSNLKVMVFPLNYVTNKAPINCLHIFVTENVLIEITLSYIVIHIVRGLEAYLLQSAFRNSPYLHISKRHLTGLTLLCKICRQIFFAYFDNNSKTFRISQWSKRSFEVEKKFLHQQ